MIVWSVISLKTDTCYHIIKYLRKSTLGLDIPQRYKGEY